MSNTADCRAHKLETPTKYSKPTCSKMGASLHYNSERRGEPILEPLCPSYLGTDEHDVWPSLYRVGDEVSPLLLQLD